MKLDPFSILPIFDAPHSHTQHHPAQVTMGRKGCKNLFLSFDSPSKDIFRRFVTLTGYVVVARQ
jgi:hypothetical protein